MSSTAHNTHALVVGGTGMLRAVSLELVRRGHIVTVLARSAARLQDLQQAAAGLEGKIAPLALDYRDSDSLKAGLEGHICQHGAIMLAVIWVHSIAPDAPALIGGLVGGDGARCRFFDVQGSSRLAELREGRHRRSESMTTLPNLIYHEVVLGAVREGRGQRWLTHDEICAGVLHAVDTGPQVYVVGSLDL